MRVRAARIHEGEWHLVHSEIDSDIDLNMSKGHVQDEYPCRYCDTGQSDVVYHILPASYLYYLIISIRVAIRLVPGYLITSVRTSFHVWKQAGPGMSLDRRLSRYRGRNTREEGTLGMQQRSMA